MEPKKYRKKPVEVEAMRLAGSASDFHAVYQWIEKHTLGSFDPLDVIEGRKPYPESGVSIDPRDGRLIISTLEGLHWADPGDWIIRGVKGEFYPCKPDIFERTYREMTMTDRIMKHEDALSLLRSRELTGKEIPAVFRAARKSAPTQAPSLRTIATAAVPCADEREGDHYDDLHRRGLR